MTAASGDLQFVETWEEKNPENLPLRENGERDVCNILIDFNMVLPIHKLKKGSVFKLLPADKQMYILGDFNEQLSGYSCLPYAGRRTKTLFLDKDRRVTVLMMFF